MTKIVIVIILANIEILSFKLEFKFETNKNKCKIAALL